MAVAGRGEHGGDGPVVFLRKGTVGERARLVERRELRRRREAELADADLRREGGAISFRERCQLLSLHKETLHYNVTQ